VSGRIEQIAEYDLDVRADSYLRYVCVDGETMFLLATVEVPTLACQVTAFDLSRGVVLGRLDVPYIKHDNGGGKLSAAAGGKVVAVGSEFAINVYDLVVVSSAAGRGWKPSKALVGPGFSGLSARCIGMSGHSN
jgi:hypothetical protein